MTHSAAVSPTYTRRQNCLIGIAGAATTASACGRRHARQIAGFDPESVDGQMSLEDRVVVGPRITACG